MTITIPLDSSEDKVFTPGTFYKFKYYTDPTNRTSVTTAVLQYISFDVRDKGTVDEEEYLYVLDWNSGAPVWTSIKPVDIEWVKDNIDVDITEIIFSDGDGEHHLNFT